MKAATTVSHCCIFLETQQSLQNSSMKLILFAILIAFTANKVTGLDEIRARILVQYHPTWEQERGLRGSTIGHYLRNIHRTNKILSNVPGSDVVLTEEIVQHGVVLLECFANVPVLWDYVGYGHPSLAATGRMGRKWGNFSDPGTYTYWTKVHLAEPGEKNTGKYVCKSVDKPDVNVHFHVFVPGFRFFVPRSGLTVGIGFHDEFLHIPCATSHPSDLMVDLYKLTVSGHPEMVLRARYDPKVGFVMDIRNDLNPWGTYICVGGNKTMTNSIIVFAKAAKELHVRVTVNSSFVPLDPLIKQHFICEGLQNVTLEFVPAMIVNDTMQSKISFDYNGDSEFPFAVELMAEPSEFADHSFIKCVHSDRAELAGPLYPSDSANRVLHAWEYSSYGNNKSLMLTFNETLEAFVCCTADSYVRPSAIYFTPCHTYQECQIRSSIDQLGPQGVHRQPREVTQAIHHYLDPKSKIDHELLPYGCIGVEQFLESHEGMLNCRLDLSDEGERDPAEVRAFCASCDDGVPVLRKIAHPVHAIDGDIIATLVKASGHATTEVKVEVSCEYSKFVFASGSQWAFGWANGSVSLVPSELLKEGTTQPVRTSIVRIPSSEIVELICLAPEWSSLRWRNSSILIKT